MIIDDKSTAAAPLPHPFDPSSLVLYPEDYWSRAEERKCFQRNESQVGINWTDVDFEQQVTSNKITSLTELCDCSGKAQTTHDGLRIIAIPQGNSWQPLKVTQEMIHKIIDTTSASAELLELFLSFYQRAYALEEAFSSAPLFKSTDNTFEVAYIFKYAFPKPDEDGSTSWVIRQTGVYQKYDKNANHSTWIFMHPRANCPFQQRLCQALASADQFAEIKQHPLLIHNMLFSTYFPNWRDYLAYNQSQVLPISPTGLSDRINDPLDENYRSLASVRSIEYSCAPLQPIFRALTKTFETLSQANNALAGYHDIRPLNTRATQQLLDNYHSHVDAYSQNALFLQGQTARAAQLLSDAISFKISMTTQAQTDYMLNLTLSTNDDSMTVRVITVVTLVYLPSTFMATLLGMNSFFEMDPDNHRLIVSPQFWIWVVCSVPLTVATVSYWWFIRRRRHRKEVQDQNLLMENV